MKEERNFCIEDPIWCGSFLSSEYTLTDWWGLAILMSEFIPRFLAVI